jgi:hypothetical protein
VKGYTPIARGSALFDTNDPNWEPLQIVGWRGDGEPGFRTVDEKRKARDRRRRKLARWQRRHMRDVGGTHA